jgi:hypothetical protein
MSRPAAASRFLSCGIHTLWPAGACPAFVLCVARAFTALSLGLLLSACGGDLAGKEDAAPSSEGPGTSGTLEGVDASPSPAPVAEASVDDTSSPISVSWDAPDPIPTPISIPVEASVVESSCNPYWWAMTHCGAGLACCRLVGAPPYVEGDAGIMTPGYSCQAPDDPQFLCTGPSDGQPCNPDTASNDPLFCARGLSCCKTNTDPTFTCTNQEKGGVIDTCVL